MIFHDFTIQAGQVVSRRSKESSTVLRAAVEVFDKMFKKHAGLPGFISPIKAGPPGYKLYISFAGDAALATLWYKEVPVTTSALLPGTGNESLVVYELQKMVLKMFADSPMEPAFDVLAVTERPIILSLILPSAFHAGREAVEMVADMETCLAAAYFERVLK